MILAGDIGGTKTILALFSAEGEKLSPHHVMTFASRDFPDFDTVIRLFLKDRSQKIDRACFGIAGPILNQSGIPTNLPWVIDARNIAQQFKVGRVVLLNDLEATAYGTLRLTSEKLRSLNPLSDKNIKKNGNRAVIAPGTGLGEVMLYWDGREYCPVASEGGHADFAPRNPCEIALLESLLKKESHISYERVLSGPGLLSIYAFMRDTGRGTEPKWLAERLKIEDPPAVISALALAGKSELCVLALDCFVSLLGAEAGNLALRTLARGGILIGGGIAPKILKKLEDGTFMKAFLHKGRFSSLLSKIPVQVILDDQTSLYGAAHYVASRV